VKYIPLLAIYLFVLFAPLTVIYYSFSPGVVLEVPPSDLTLRWYANLLEQERLVAGIGYSTLVALFAAASALLVGVPAAYALARGRFPGREAISGLLLSPLNLPGIVLAMGILMVLARFAIPVVGSVWPLLAAHLLVTVPWVIRTVTAGLEQSDPHLEEAARGLGASPLAAFFLVTIPSVRPSIVAGAIFAFIVSFGNFALSLFFASGRITTLPVAIFEYIDQFQDPTVAAASTLVIVGTAGLSLLAARATKSSLL
jgi:putative spermidine/putrescine transport system permease protein